MKQRIEITSDDPRINQLHFTPHRSTDQRHVVRFLPGDNEPQTREIVTSWGGKLTIKKGDLLVSNMEDPQDAWPVEAEIFAKTYTMTGPDTCIKSAVNMLAPLTDLTEGDEDQMVSVRSLEGVVTVRAGDFYLARGVHGEIWAFPRHKAVKVDV